MSSRIIPMDDLAERSIMYWLPPGGHDNGVWATNWVVLAELEAADVAPVLDGMADAEVGAYAARQTRGNSSQLLYIDAMQYNQAMDVLMIFLRRRESRGRPPGAASVPRASAHDDARGRHVARQRAPWVTPPVTPPVSKGRTAARVAIKVAKGVFCAALVIGVLALVYLIGSTRFPTAHPLPSPPAGVPLAP